MAVVYDEELDLSRYGYVPGDKFVAYVSSYTRAGRGLITLWEKYSAMR